MKQLILGVYHKDIVDLFAGGGGWSTACEDAWNRSPDIAINHDPEAISMHRANHPQTRHFVADVYEVCPHVATRGRPVGWLHLSPDCTHHSQASGGQPRNKKIRGLSWVGYRWAGQVLPDVISLENVKQILKWGPLIAKRDKETGRVIKLNGDVAAPGERVPVQQQYLVPDPRRAGKTWKAFVHKLRGLGYVVEWSMLCAADYGGHTTRERLFMLARRDGLPIVWPEKTHQKKPVEKPKKPTSGKKHPVQTKAKRPVTKMPYWRPAADCIDFSDLGRSIFGREKPLVAATLRRIADCIKRCVLDNPEPFIIQIAHYSKGNKGSVHPVSEPLRTITARTKGGEFALVTPCIAQHAHSGDEHVVMPYMVQANAGFNTTTGRSVDEPMSTITGTGSQQQFSAAILAHLHTLTPEQMDGALQVAAFLMEYYGGGGQWNELDKPINTITTKDRFALVTVWIAGKPRVIIDIRLRMLSPRELYLAQDFPHDYIIDRGHDGRRLSKMAQVRMCGNSVNPVCASALLKANAPWLAVGKRAA